MDILFLLMVLCLSLAFILLLVLFLIERRKRKRQEVLLTESLNKVRFFRSFADFTHDWEFWRTDSGRFLYISPSCRDITGYGAEDFYADPDLFFRILHPDDREDFRKILEDTENEKNGITFRIMTADGRVRWMEHVFKRVRGTDSESYGYLGANRDITERKRYEKDLTEALRKAKEADKAKSRFLANMSHEIRTPLNAIIGFSDLLSISMNDGQHRSYLEAISSAGRSLQNLISDILDLSRIESGRMSIHYSAVDLEMLVTEIERLFRIKVMEKGLMLRSTMTGTEGLRFKLDENRLRQILINLVNNAIKYTNDGDIQISVLAAPEEKDSSLYRLTLVIKDTGEGIDPQNLDKIFVPFEQLHQDNPDVEGTGLGLAITKSLVDLLGAEIKVRSQLGNGSTFTVVFHDVPLETSLPKRESDLPFDAVRFEGQSVLVVDDVPSNLLLLENFLEKVNLKPLTAENGKKALQLAEQEKPSAIIMDIRMPVLDGEEATRRLKSNPATRDIPVFALTASAKSREAKERFEDLFEAILTKPLRLSQIISVLSRKLDFTIYTRKAEAINGEEEIMPAQPELLAELDEFIAPKIESNKNFTVHDDIVALADTIEELSRKYQSTLLEHYGRELKESARSFNMGYITNLLERFPAVRDMIEHGGQGDRKAVDTDH